MRSLIIIHFLLVQFVSLPGMSIKPTGIFENNNIGFTDSLPASVHSITDSLTKHLSWSAQLMAFGRTTAFARATGTVNPDNRIARLNKYDGGIYIRPELRYKAKQFEVWVKPRLHIDINADDGALWRQEGYSAKFYFQEFKAKWQITKSIYLLGGRYVKYLGTSAFFNPSNPFIMDNLGTLNPKLEIEPMDFVEVNLSTKTDWNFSLIANLNDANKTIYQWPFLKFSRTYGLFSEYYGESENFGLIASIDEAQKYHLGFYGHRNVSQALVVWTDCAFDYNINRFYPVAGSETNLLNYEMVNADNNKGLFFTGLFGASYTLKSGPTLQVNYLYNGKGYSRQQYNLFNDMISSSAQYNFDITKELANLNLGRALNTGTLYLRHHYIFSNIGDNDLFGQVNYNLRYLYSVDDHGSQLSSLVEWNVKDNLEIFSVSLANFGGRKKDFNKLVDYQIMVGVLFKM